MKKLLLAIVWLASVSATAQVTPEFIYMSGFVSPLNLDGAVAKYSFVDGVAGEVKVFNANHNLWKTITVPGFVGDAHISSTLFNTDALVEVAYRAAGDTVRLITETGNVLFSADSAKSVRVDALVGAPPAIAVNEPYDAAFNPFHSVYRGPTFTRIGPRPGWGAYREYLANGDEAIISHMSSGSWIRVQAIVGTSSGFLQGFPGTGGRFLSSHIVNSDSKYEAVFQYYGSTPNAKLIADDGTVLLSTVSSSGNIGHSRIAGQPDKIIVQDNTENKVYSAPGLQLEHTYSFENGQYGQNGIYRVALETSGVKYYRLNPASNAIEFYNSNHTFWKSVPLAVLSGPTLPLHIIDISEKTVNNDNQVEVLYEQYIAGRYQGRVTNDLGSTLLIYDVKQSASPVLHRFPDGTAKLIVYQDTASQTHTRIYGFPMTIPAGIEEAAQSGTLPATIAPNPTGNLLTISFSSAAPRTISLYSLQSTQVLTSECKDATFTGDVATLPRGMYQVIIREGEKRHVSKVVLQ